MTNQQTTMKEIQKVLHNQTRSNFEKSYHHAAGNQRALEELTKLVREELARQNAHLSKIQLEIDVLSSDDERRDYIMSVNDGGVRQALIQANYDLFNNAPATQRVVNDKEVVYDQVSGLYMDQKQLDEEKRKRIMSIPDSEERQKMIAMNAHLF